MAEDRDKDAPSLEPPSLFGRKRRKTSRSAPIAPVAPVTPVEPVRARRARRARRPRVEPVDRVDPVEPVATAAPVVTAARLDPDTIFDDTTEPTTVSPLTPPPAPEAPSEPRAPREPWLTGRPAAIVTGLVVGGLIVAATSGSMRLCSEVKGTSSCGGQGFFLMIAILVVAVLVGAAMLRLAQVPEPGSTSFLAVGLLSVATLLFLVGSIFEWWMAIAIPLVSLATFLLSHWVTSNYVDPVSAGSVPDVEPERHDVR